MMERWAWRRPPRLEGRHGAAPGRPWRPPSAWSMILVVVSVVLVLAMVSPVVEAVVPFLHQDTIMKLVRVPSDVKVGTRIYRLKCTDSDRDYPLTWKVEGRIGSSLVEIRPHSCSKSNNIYCEADVHTIKAVEAQRTYKFNITVTDSRNDQTMVEATIIGTRGYTNLRSIFPSYDYNVIVPEDSELQKEIASVVVNKKLSASFIHFDIQGDSSHLFKITGKFISSDEVRGAVILENKLDYEKQSSHNIEICAMNPYTDEEIDTRNIACIQLTVSVGDRQDMPPQFLNAPPFTVLSGTTQPGDVILRLEARDGDQQNPRPIRFSLVPLNSAFEDYFKIDPFKGSIEMVESLQKLLDAMTSLEPIVVAVTAEEVVSDSSTRYPAQVTEIKLAFMVSESDLPPPKFLYEKYTGSIRENPQPASEVYFPSAFIQGGVITLYSIEIEGDQGIFDVAPAVIRENEDFVIHVKNPQLLDYEQRKQVDFKIIARPVTGPRTQSSTALVTVKIQDENDNPPKFSQSLYSATIDENAFVGTKVVQIVAEDPDEGSYGSIRYTRINGQMSNHFVIDPVTGWVTVASNKNDFDRDHGSGVYQLTIEARDGDGSGNSVTARLNINIRDVNDEAPKFKKDVYSGVLEPNFKKLRQSLVIEAEDDDSEAPNNQVYYEIERSTYSDFFSIDRSTGLLDVRIGREVPVSPLRRENAAVKLDPQSRKKRQVFYDGIEQNDYILLSVMATDLGDPPLSTVVPVKIHTKEYVDYITTFIYPQSQTEVLINEKQVERTLSVLTGADTQIQRVEPYSKGLYGSMSDPNKSYLTVLVRTKVNSVIDVDAITKELNQSSSLVQAKQQADKQIVELRNSNSSYLTWVVVLCLFLVAFILMFAACFLCAGCPLYRGRKQMSMVTDENGEGVSYIKMDEYGNKIYQQEKIWWDYLPTCLTDLFLSCGCRRPETGNYINNSRMAWSADERHRYWHIEQPGGEMGVVDERAMPRQLPRDRMHIEDIDEARLHRQNTLQNVPRMEMQQTGPNGEPRRVFVIKDPNGNPQVTDHLKEGETYLVEDVDETPRNIHLHEAQIEANAGGGNGGGGDYGLRNPGNEENLRLHAGPRVVDSHVDSTRRHRRAGVEPGGTQYPQGGDEGGGGIISSRYVDGQSGGNTQRSDYRNVHQSGQQTNSAGMVAAEARRRAENDAVMPRLRIKTPDEEDMMEDIEGMTSKGRQGYRSDRSDIPGRDPHSYLQKTNNFGYQHTKSSLLRYEANMAKLEEDQQRLMEKDPLYSTFKEKDAVQAEARKAAAYAADDMSLETSRTLSQAALELKQRRDTVGYDKLDSFERTGSVPNMQTALEKEAANRRGSIAADELYEGKNKSLSRQSSQQKKDGTVSNLSDDAKKLKKPVAIEGEMSPEALRALEEEMKKDSEEGDEASKAATDKSRKKRNQMTEKKSIFTIAYDDMVTKQLRPESAHTDP